MKHTLRGSTLAETLVMMLVAEAQASCCTSIVQEARRH